MKSRYINHYTQDKICSIECPHCGKEAIITNDNNIELLCQNCFYKAIRDDYVYYCARVKLNCPECGTKIYENKKKLKEKTQSIFITCNNCSVKFSYSPRYQSYINIPEFTGLKCDFYFGFPLWFQTQIRGKNLWAYNRTQLVEMLNYIKSELRERNDIPYFLRKLPRYFKLSKNRENVIKAINKMLIR